MRKAPEVGALKEIGAKSLQWNGFEPGDVGGAMSGDFVGANSFAKGGVAAPQCLAGQTFGLLGE
ncbi:hypothetical protein Pres01_43300 [Metapseudomonas resinovorans]|nr:hypothetical protein Pres01_43300 [Pseudomonas resinovorans]